MKLNWQSRSLEECIERVKYDSKIPRSEFLKAGLYPIVSQEADFVNGFWNDPADLFKIDRPVIVFGDHTKVLKYVDFDFVIGADGVKVLKPKPFLSPKYFYYYLRSVRLGHLGYARHYRLLTKIRVNYPPFSEQERIAAVLDEMFEGISTAVANSEKSLRSVRELFDRYLNFVFCEEGAGGTEKSFSDICEITSKLVDPREPEFIDLLHLGAGNMVSLTGEVIDVKTAREEGLKSGKFLFDETMVLYSKIRPYLMKACRPDFHGLCSADVYPLLPNPQQLDRDFLFYMLMSRKFTDYAIAGSDRAGMPKVNRDHLFRYKTWLPPVAEQKRIASKLDALSAECRGLEAIFLQKLGAFAELKQAILQMAFTGGLTQRSVSAMQEAAE